MSLGRRLQRLGNSSFPSDTVQHVAWCLLSDREGAAVQGSLPTCILPSSTPMACREKEHGCVTGLGVTQGHKLQLRICFDLSISKHGSGWLYFFFFLSYIKGIWKPHCIFLNFKMTSWVGRELLPYCAILRQAFLEAESFHLL